MAGLTKVRKKGLESRNAKKGNSTGKVKLPGTSFKSQPQLKLIQNKDNNTNSNKNSNQKQSSS
jgi:hypothetical protein